MTNPLQKQFEQHVVFQKLKEVRSSLDEVLNVEGQDEQSKGFVERISFVLEETANRLEVANPFFVRMDLLNNLNSCWNDVNAQLRAYLSNKNSANLASANGQVDNVVSLLPSLPIPQRGSWVEEVGKAARRAKTELISHANEVSRAREAAASALGEATALKAKIDQEKDEFAKLQAKLQADFDVDAKKRIAEHGKLIQDGVKEFADAREIQRAEFQKFVDERRNVFQQDEKARFDEVQAFRKDLEARLSEAQTFLTEKKDEVEKVVQATGSASMTGEFQNVGKNAAKSANLWRVLAAGSLGLLFVIGIGVLALELFGTGKVEWQDILQRLNITIPALLFAGYAAAQAHRFQRIEESNKRVSVELSSIDPYLANLPKVERDSLKAALAPRYFQGVKHERHSEADVIPSVAGAVQNLTRSK